MTDIDVIGPRTAVELGIGMGIIIPESVRADFMNWTLAPHNRWSFQRVQQFARTARIPRAVKPSVLSENLLELGGIVFTNSHGEQTTVDEMLAQTWTDGILIMHRGRVVFLKNLN